MAAKEASMGLDCGGSEEKTNRPSVANDEDEDDTLVSYKDFWSKGARRKEGYKKGDIVMARWKHYARWPYVVGNVNQKRRRVSLYDLSRNLPLVKGTKPDVSVSIAKLEPYEKEHCDVTENVFSSYASLFLRATSQADAIIEQNLDPFVDTVIADTGELSENVAVVGSVETRSINLSIDDNCQELEDSENEDETDCDIEILTPPPGMPDQPSERAIEYRRNLELLDAIKSEQTEAYLVKVMRNEVPSARRDEFFALMETGRLGYRWLNCAPLSLERQIEETVMYMYAVKRKHARDLCGSNGNSFAESVLLPDAISFCLKDVWRLSDQQTELSMAQPEYFFQLIQKRD